MPKYILVNAEKHPAVRKGSKTLSPRVERETRTPRQMVGIMCKSTERIPFRWLASPERLLIRIISRTENGRYRGIVGSLGGGPSGLKFGDMVHFGPEHVFETDLIRVPVSGHEFYNGSLRFPLY